MKERNKYPDELHALDLPQLETLLQEELAKDPPDDDRVLELLRALEERKYPEDEPAQHRRSLARRLIPIAASLVIVLGVLFFTVPTKANAGPFFVLLTRWRSEFFELLSPESKDNMPLEYEFKTNHPGLREVYNEASKLGVSGPAVPMWLPDGSELIECKVIRTRTLAGLTSRFDGVVGPIVFCINKIYEEKNYGFYREDAGYTEVEIRGVNHYIMRNKDTWTVVWTRDDIECSIMMDCQEDTLYQILESIYIMEDLR